MPEIRTSPAVIGSPAEEPARFFELDPDSLPEVGCPDCGQSLDLDTLVRRHWDGGPAFSIGGITLGDVVDAANEHECAEEDDDG